MNDLDCCSSFASLREQFALEWDPIAGGFGMSLRETNRNTGADKRFLLTLYYCPYCGSNLDGGEHDT